MIFDQIFTNYFRRIVVVFTIIFSGLAPSIGLACVVNVPIMKTSSTLVKSTANIVIARATSYKGSKQFFDVIEILKGKVKKTFSQPLFRLNCRPFGDFKNGHYYLIFLNNYDARMANEVKPINDIWVHEIRNIIRFPKTQFPTSKTHEEWVAYSKHSAKALIQDCDGPILKITKVFKGNFTENQKTVNYKGLETKHQIFSNTQCIEGKFLFIAEYEGVHRISTFYKYTDEIVNSTKFMMNVIHAPLIDPTYLQNLKDGFFKNFKPPEVRTPRTNEYKRLNGLEKK